MYICVSVSFLMVKRVYKVQGNKQCDKGVWQACGVFFQEPYGIVASVHVRSPCSPRLAEVGTPNGIDVMGGDIPKSGQDLAGAGGTSMVRVVPQC